MAALRDLLRRTKVDVRPWEMAFDEHASEDDVYYCFRLILGRNPSKSEWAGHRSLVGNSLQEVVQTYLSSREFKNRRFTSLEDTEHRLVELDGFKMYVSVADGAVGRHIHAAKTYEPHVSRALAARLRTGDYFVDIGANIGYFSMLAAHLVGKDGRVFSFEPFQYNVKLLYLNRLLNGFDHVSLYPFALADREGLVAYDNSASNGVISPAQGDIHSLLATTLTYAARLDQVLRDVEKVNAVKIDVEGAEYLAMNGARRLLQKHRPIVLSEFSPPALAVVSRVSAEAYLELLMPDDGYEISVLTPQGGVIPCARDVGRVLECFEQSGIDHIDVVVDPS